MVANATLRPQPTTALVEAGAPMWGQRLALKLLGVFQPLFPRAPNRVWVCQSADLPPPEEWPGALVTVPDLACIAVSDGTDWRRINMGAPI